MSTKGFESSPLPGSRSLNSAPPLPECRDAIFQADGAPVRIARPGLVVVAGYLYGSGLYEAFELAGIRTLSAAVDWGRDVLTQLDRGDLDLGIYNQLETEKYLTENSTSSIHLIGSIGASMGGKNFAITASSKSDLVGTSIDQLASKLQGRRLYVGKSTDRYTNILKALRMSDQELESTGVLIIDLPDPGLALIKHDPEALLVCGQNARIAAQKDPDFVELLNFDSLRESDKNHFLESSQNCLVFSDRLFGMLRKKPLELMKHLMSRLTSLNLEPERLEKLLNYLRVNCFSYAEQNEFDCDELARQIMYETYHVGERVW